MRKSRPSDAVCYCCVTRSNRDVCFERQREVDLDGIAEMRKTAIRASGLKFACRD